MNYYRVLGIDEHGLAYSSSNERRDWALRGTRQGSQCFGLCEMSNYDGQLKRLAVIYSWNPTDGYEYDPVGDIERSYSDPVPVSLPYLSDNEEAASTPGICR